MKDLFNDAGFDLTEFKAEPEGKAYAACTFEVGDCKVVGRCAKITPRKVGQFVTLWKRVSDGPIQPYDADDEVDFFVVLTQTDSEAGYFKFPKAALIAQGVVAGDGSVGKRATRVYPPWDSPTSRQASKTQAWQAPYFVRLQVSGGQVSGAATGGPNSIGVEILHPNDN